MCLMVVQKSVAVVALVCRLPTCGLKPAPISLMLRGTPAKSQVLIHRYAMLVSIVEESRRLLA